MKRTIMTAIMCIAALAVSLAGCAKRDRYINCEHTVGTFSGYVVRLQKVPFGGETIDEIVEYEVGGVYIASLPDPSWEYVVEESDDERIYLTDAYLIGIISRADLLAIAAAEAEYYSAQK